MVSLNFILIAALFIIVGFLFLLVEDFREPTLWRFYFPPIYEKNPNKDRLVTYRTIKPKVKTALAWYFIAVGTAILGILTVF